MFTRLHSILTSLFPVKPHTKTKKQGSRITPDTLSRKPSQSKNTKPSSSGSRVQSRPRPQPNVALVDRVSVTTGKSLSKTMGELGGKSRCGRIRLTSDDIVPIQRGLLPGGQEPWICDGLRVYDAATMIQNWSIEIVMGQLRQSGYHILCGTVDERWVPSIIIRHGNVLAGVFVHTIWNTRDLTVLDDTVLQRLLTWCVVNNAVPLVCVMGVHGTLDTLDTVWRKLAQNHGFRISSCLPSLLYDVLQECPFSLSDYMSSQRVSLSAFELHEASIRVVCDELEQLGYEIERWNPDMGLSPQIWCKHLGVRYHILIQYHLYMEPAPVFSDDMIADARGYAKSHNCRLQCFCVTLASGKSTLVGSVSEGLFRGEPIDYIVNEIDI